jgi:membrane protease YdiL (CAAX protease family)
VKQWLNDARVFPLAAGMIVLAGPFVEETVFRGFLQPVAIRWFGPALGVAIVSAGFALIHGPTYRWSWQHLLAMALAGCAFGATRLLTGSTIAAFLLHSLYNLTMLYAYLKQV